MTTPVRPPARLSAAWTDLQHQAQRVGLEAHALGVCDGMEFAAKLIDAAMGVAGLSDEQWGIAAFLRDEIRLAIFSVPDPEIGATNG
jgi:hypothetical protein